VRENERRIDPAADGWRSEELHDAAKPLLKSFLHAAVEGHAAGDVALAPGFSCTTLRPPAAVVREDAALSVRRATAIPSERHGVEELPRLIAEFRAAAPDHAEAGTFLLKTVSVELDGEDRFRMRAFLNAHAAAEDGAGVQWNLEIESEWTIGEAGAPVLAGLALLRYEEIVGRGGLLPDYSARAFGATPGWQEQILHGTTDWTGRVDRSFGRSYVGGQGIAIGDVDGDGHDDAYFCQPAGQPNKLWLWREGGVAEEASARMGVDFLDKTRSAVLADFDNDGWQDLAISIGMDVALCWSEGGRRFTTERVRGTGTDEIYTMAAADADGDGLLDLYACRYSTGGLVNGVPHPVYDARNGAPNLFWRNLGGRRMRESTGEFGFDHNNDRFSLAAMWEDFDDDGDSDLYVVNDFGRNNLYLNEDGRFRDVADERGAEDLSPGMGASAADADLDGDLDIYVTNMFSSAGRRIATQADLFTGGARRETHGLYQRHARGNSLLLNDGRGSFTDASDAAGISVGLWGWGSLFFELDNDGYADIYAPNGFLTNESTTDL
jgi:hypothetical protein